MAGNTSIAGATVTSRVLAIIGAFDERHRVLTLSELARRSGLPVATTHRLAAELVAGDALARRPDGRFVVGRLLWEAGLRAPVTGRLKQVAEPFLHDVYAATPGDRAPRGSRWSPGALCGADGRACLGADRQHRRQSAPVALHRRRQGAVGARTG